MNYIDISFTGSTVVYFSLLDSTNSDDCAMVLNGLSTNEESVINLGTDFSNYKNRYNEYHIDYNEVKDLTPDLYACRVIDNVTDQELDRSFIQIKDSSIITEIISPSFNVDDDDIAYIKD